jgi:hypothetical protein
MVAPRTIVDVDMRVPSFRQLRPCDMHFFQHRHSGDSVKRRDRFPAYEA